jgi:hypothetical protein
MNVRLPDIVDREREGESRHGWSPSSVGFKIEKLRRHHPVVRDSQILVMILSWKNLSIYPKGDLHPLRLFGMKKKRKRTNKNLLNSFYLSTRLKRSCSITTKLVDVIRPRTRLRIRISLRRTGASGKNYFAPYLYMLNKFKSIQPWRSSLGETIGQKSLLTFSAAPNNFCQQ